MVTAGHVQGTQLALSDPSSASGPHMTPQEAAFLFREGLVTAAPGAPWGLQAVTPARCAEPKLLPVGHMDTSEGTLP